jgi:hypothetical protein
MVHDDVWIAGLRGLSHLWRHTSRSFARRDRWLISARRRTSCWFMGTSSTVAQSRVFRTRQPVAASKRCVPGTSRLVLRVTHAVGLGQQITAGSKVGCKAWIA